ncbi:MAG: hypothetical protein GX640_17415 [Fibrobacter sp.]|nr:hypothetical protein [Fibrobacter sp.]
MKFLLVILVNFAFIGLAYGGVAGEKPQNPSVKKIMRHLLSTKIWHSFQFMEAGRMQNSYRGSREQFFLMPVEKLFKNWI